MTSATPPGTISESGVRAQRDDVPRICFVVSSALTAHAFLTDQVRALSEHYEVDLIVNADPPSIVNEDLRRATLHRARIERSIAPAADLRALIELAVIFGRGRYAAVHSLTPKAGLLTAIAAFAARVPVRVHTFTGQVWATRQGPMRSLLKALDIVIALLNTHLLVDSASQLDFLRTEHVLRANQGEVIGKGSVSGVDAVRFRPDSTARAAVRAELALPAAAIIFLFVGRVTRDKGILDLGAAFAELARERDDVYLVMVGPDEEGLGQAIRRICAGSEARLRFAGSSEQPEKFMAAADIFCLPSYREGFGSVVIEAAAAGLPAIGSRIYGIVDAIEDGATGLLVAAGDVTALAAAMRRMATDDRVRASLGAAARERALRDFSKESITAAVVNFYSRALADKNVARRTKARESSHFD